MLKGIDVSSWQGDIQVQNMPVDFVITKATEGVNYINPYCDPVIQRCISSGKLWGFYHYAKDNDAVAEADYFIENSLNYFNHGIPVLDWEENQRVDWVNRFVRRIHERTGVWCWIYANPWRFNQGGVDSRCGRWIASYPDVVNPPVSYNPGEPPYTDGLICCWQFASDGMVPGYSGNLDVNVFYGDENAWFAYAGVPKVGQSENKPTTPSVLENGEYKVTIEQK